MPVYNETQLSSFVDQVFERLRRYRELTGCGMAAAQEMIAKL
ncbi:MAG TPA: hypothetical protein VMS11_02040 [Solirubrobacterales bacterium]|nr:hypothetical protein [Solirubrobacterales bacterium]